MNPVLFWTKVLIALFLCLPASYGKETPQAYSLPKLQSLRKTVLKKITECEKKKCSSLKILRASEKIIVSAIVSQTRVEQIQEENKELRDQAEALEKSVPFSPRTGCQKTKLLEEKMIELGINENGNLLYSKKAAGDWQGKCWANGKKKIETTVVLCDFPLAVNVMTTGGRANQTINRSVEYLFSLNACDLISVKLSNSTGKKKKDLFLSVPTCLQEWNKRGSDASMTKEQVKVMEETISQCFKYQILPAPDKIPAPKSGNAP